MAAQTKEALDAAAAEKLEKLICDQQKFIIKSLGLDARSLSERNKLATYINDLETAIFEQDNYLYDKELVEINPLNYRQKAQSMLEEAQIIYELCCTHSFAWVSDRVHSFCVDFGSLFLVGDFKFRQNYTLIINVLKEALKRHDTCAIADLFFAEVPSVLRYCQVMEPGLIEHDTHA